MSILPLPVSNKITGFIKAFLQPEYMPGNDRWMCPQCSSLQDSTRETVFTQCGDILIIQLKRFNCIQGRSVKNNKFVSCLAQGHETLKVYSHPAEDISFTNQYKLTATNNHSGTLAAGHYWAFIRDQGVKTWLKCDDRAVISVKPSDLDNSTVLPFCKEAKLAHLVYRVNDPAIPDVTKKLYKGFSFLSFLFP
ncbi:ubiquitin carboxyl-terminal hydrolase 51-like [Hydractinia symbiolongicarpus]|uniref:ubiquitin carboxyl-terminal hydrolase 51-like n=1 Tax=Hydractinia symbiolongicarpus TaxID=13093 RepID=UPI002551058F|nr:ubiquitin carboxyl-terminal hydrolase 51-like [Hydractinia symbiolongicarpus]